MPPQSKGLFRSETGGGSRLRSKGCATAIAVVSSGDEATHVGNGDAGSNA
jgi:hypothetical protein